MEKKKWKTKIVRYCKNAGTYKPFFDGVIDTLAGILENRDKAQEQYEATGAEPVVIHTNRAGEENFAKNPALAIILDCNAQALSYWRDLGLTSKAWQAMMKDEKLNGEKKDGIDEFFKGLGL